MHVTDSTEKNDILSQKKNNNIRMDRTKGRSMNSVVKIDYYLRILNLLVNDHCS
jgi:hypothetical protein